MKMKTRQRRQTQISHHCGKGEQSSAVLHLAAATWPTSQHVLACPSVQRGPCPTSVRTVTCPL